MTCSCIHFFVSQMIVKNLMFRNTPSIQCVDTRQDDFETQVITL